MGDRSYIIVSDGTTACDALRLCGCVPSCFLSTTPSIVDATSCIKSPIVSGTTICAPRVIAGGLSSTHATASYQGKIDTTINYGQYMLFKDEANTINFSIANGSLGTDFFPIFNGKVTSANPAMYFVGNSVSGPSAGTGIVTFDGRVNNAGTTSSATTVVNFVSGYGSSRARIMGDCTFCTGNVCAGTKIISPALQVTTGAASGCVLVSDANGNATWQTPSAGASALSGLTDTNISSPATGNILTYSGSTWCNVAPVDVSSNLTTGRVVCYDGTTLATATCVTTQCYFEFTTVGVAHGIRSCGASANAGNTFNILGEDSVGTSQSGGPIIIAAGCGGATNGSGGCVGIRGGTGVGSGSGGQLHICGGCGTGTGQGGQVFIYGGNALSNTTGGGHINICPGNYSGGRGCIFLYGCTGTGGDIYFCGLSTSTAAYDVLIDINGCISYCTKASDCRLKCNLSIITGATSILNNACGYSAEFYGTNTVLDGACKYVLLAQDIEAELPLAVQNDLVFDSASGSTVYKRIEYEQIIPVLWNAVREQQAKINELETRILTLENN